MSFWKTTLATLAIAAAFLAIPATQTFASTQKSVAHHATSSHVAKKHAKSKKHSKKHVSKHTKTVAHHDVKNISATLK